MEENIEQEVEILNRMSPELSKVFGTQDLEGVLDIDIKFAHIPILCQIQTLKSPTMGELGEISNFQLSTLTRVVDRLVERGLVAREADSFDRRVVRVSITNEGSQIVRKFEMARKKKVKSILMRLTSRERKDLIRVLQDIHKRISSEQ
jgi:DNA-binding MarR family transcriptional regulator